MTLAKLLLELISVIYTEPKQGEQRYKSVKNCTGGQLSGSCTLSIVKCYYRNNKTNLKQKFDLQMILLL